MRKILIKTIFYAAIGVIFTTFAAQDALADNPQDILIVAHNSVPQKSITIAELRDLFLKKRTNWQSGGKAQPLHVRAGTPLRDRFRQVVLGLSAREEARYWQDQRIRHGKTEPVEFSNPLKAVYKLRGALSYIYRSDFKEGVAKILLVIPAN